MRGETSRYQGERTHICLSFSKFSFGSRKACLTLYPESLSPNLVKHPKALLEAILQYAACLFWPRSAAVRQL